MFHLLGAQVFLSVGFLLANSQPPTEKQVPDNVQKAKDVVSTHLAQIKGSHGTILHISDNSLAKTFPKHVFFAVRYRLFPVAEQRPEGMAASNVFAVKDDKLVHLKDAEALEAYFQANGFGSMEETARTAAVRSWLWLSQEFVQDGFYKFEILDKEFAGATKRAQTWAMMSGRAVVMQGGNGDVKVTITFSNNKILNATDATKVIPGPRPICQATKLLDPDPIVRKMAEQDLLYMGLAAREYLMEQRAKASPELRQAIDLLWDLILKNQW